MYNYHFISYSSADAQDFALKLADALLIGPPSFPVWLDKRALRPGDGFDSQIAEAIKLCESMIFVMSRDSVEDASVCKAEWAYAFRYKKPVTPLLLHRDAEMPFRFGARQFIDFTGDFEIGLAKLRTYLAWLDTPAGQLQALKDRLADAVRDQRRASDPNDLQRIADEIALLKQQIAHQQQVVDHPEAAAQRVEESIARGLERERQPEQPLSGERHTKFINPPPGAAPAHFQDRYVETQLLRDFLQNDAQRLLTVVGRGGIGKTAMVCRLLRALESGHLPDDLGPLAVDGIVYLSQTGTHQVNVPNLYGDLCKLLSTSDAQRLENLYKDPQIPIEAKLRALLATFPQGRVLALLDNLEDGIDPATRALTDPDLDEALRAILSLPQHALKVIATTRVAPQALALVHPERQMPLVLDEGLASPYAENILRAMDADGKLGLKNAPAALLATARERTQGYPRALEMLFASLNADRATSLHELLADTRALLPEYVVEVLVGEAYSRLDRTAQMVMQALAIYARPVMPAAVDYVLQAHLPGVNSAPVLNRLVNMYFVRKEEGRYYLHPVDRAYAFGRVPVGAATDREAAEMHYTQYALLDRAADYFHQARLPDEQWKRLDDLAPQLAEFDLRYAGEDYDTAAAVLQEIVVIIHWGHYKLYVQHGEKLRDKITDLFLKARWVVNLGQAYFYLGEFQMAIPLLKQGLQEVGGRYQGYIHNTLGNCYADMGQTQQAIESYEQALLILPDASDILGNLGTCYADMGQNDQAKGIYTRVLQNAGTSALYPCALYAWLADVLIEEQQYEEAIEWATKGKEAAMATNDSLAASLNHLSLATACLLSNNLADARKAAKDGSQYESPRSKHTVLALLGLSAVRQGDYIAAEAAFQAALIEADSVLVRNSNNYLALDAKGLALAGLAICKDKQSIPLAVDAYRAARAVTCAPGIVQRALRLVDALAVVDAAGVLVGVRAMAAGEG